MAGQQWGTQQDQQPVQNWDQYQQQMAQQALADKKRLSELQAEMADRPEYAPWEDLRETGADGQPGLMREPYQLKDPTAGSRIGLGMLQQEASRTGPSAWRTMEEGQQADLMAKRGAGQMAQAQSNLAMRGGLRGGAGERMQSSGIQQQLTGRQGLAGQMGLADEKRRMQAMGQLPGAELQEATFQRGTDQFNIQQALTEQAQKRMADAKKYQEEMRGWAAERTAEATPSSGGGGGMCFITTAVCETLGLPDDNPFLNTFRKFRDEHMGGKGAVSDYYEIAPKIVESIKEKGEEDIYYVILAKDLLPAHNAIKQGRFAEAEAIYTDMVKGLKAIYLGDK